jgi:hypothetical protein
MTHPHVSNEEEEEPPGVLEEEEEPPADVEEEPPPTSSSSRPLKRCLGAREEWCGGGWSFPPSACARKEEWCGLREKQTFRSGLRPAASRAPSAC